MTHHIRGGSVVGTARLINSEGVARARAHKSAPLNLHVSLISATHRRSRQRLPSCLRHLLTHFTCLHLINGNNCIPGVYTEGNRVNTLCQSVNIMLGTTTFELGGGIPLPNSAVTVTDCRKEKFLLLFFLCINTTCLDNYFLIASGTPTEKHTRVDKWQQRWRFLFSRHGEISANQNILTHVNQINGYCEIKGLGFFVVVVFFLYRERAAASLFRTIQQLLLQA